MNHTFRLVTRLVIVLLVTFGLVSNAEVAHAQDSVTLPGQVDVSQCPAGYQYSTGLEVRIGVGTFTVCYSAPDAADQLRQQQDADFQSRIASAQAAAQAQSEQWNEANPGFQKCFQWGPVVHANGISTASGGACANIVAPPTPASPVATEPLIDTTVLPLVAPLTATGQPFTIELTGQHAVSDCPVGYQGANGLSVNATTGVVTTVCWSPAAWLANQIGGDAWAQFVSSGGTYNPQNEINRQAAVANLKMRAQSTAQAAADATPGVQRCTTWTGYGSTGTECAYAGVTASPAPTARPNPEATTSSDQSSGAAPADDPVQSAAAKFIASVTRVASTTKATSITLPASTQVTVKYATKSTSVCAIVKNKIVRKASGTCTVTATVIDATGIKFTSTKKVVFTK